MDGQVTRRWRMPAEWEAHEGTWLGWPHEKSDWPGKFAPIPYVYGKIMARLSRHEAVHVLCQAESEIKLATRLARREGAVEANLDFHLCPTDRSWVRDTAPIFTVDDAGGLCATDWHFNGWAKYPNWQRDDKVPAYVAKKLKCARVTPKAGGKRFVLEGGSIDVNGAGLLLTTEECLLSPIQARNPHLNREQIEEVLREHLGLERVIWLLNGIEGDDTHGHVDDLARFTNRTTVVIATRNAKKDPNVQRLKEAGGLEIVPLPMPGEVRYDGQLLPASYANFYIANQQVLVPTFNDANDRAALQTLSRLFPDREVAGIDCTDLVLGLGTLHCMTQQQPAAAR
ncbi:MAG: agmatine deiminase family protein [Bryobacterales bacterium]|nr:agmatine deiminase family protein [Bryobacterales bacterium]